MIKPTFEEIYKYCEKIKIEKKYIGIYGIPRGGLIPAVIISHLTGIPLVFDNKGCVLLVDDIFDSGETIKKHTEENKKAYPFVIFSRNNKEINHGYFIDSDDWVLFPWENKNINNIENDKLDYMKGL